MVIGFVGHLRAWALSIAITLVLGAIITWLFRGHGADPVFPFLWLYLILGALSAMVALFLPIILMPEVWDWEGKISYELVPGRLILEGIAAGMVDAIALLVLAWVMLGVSVLQPQAVLCFCGTVAACFLYAIARGMPDEDALELAADSGRLIGTVLAYLVRALRRHQWLLALGLLAIGCVAAFMWYMDFP